MQTASFCKVCRWYGMVWYGMAWYGMVWHGMVWYMNVCMYVVAYWWWLPIHSVQSGKWSFTAKIVSPPLCIQHCSSIMIVTLIVNPAYTLSNSISSSSSNSAVWYKVVVCMWWRRRRWPPLFANISITILRQFGSCQCSKITKYEATAMAVASVTSSPAANCIMYIL